MSSNVIPFGIAVNPIRHTFMRPIAPDNPVMDYKTTEGQAIVRLAREKKLDVFESDGGLNESKLARALTSAAGSRVHQSTLTRLLKGELAGKQKTLQPIADGFGMTYVEFISRIRPSVAAPAVSTGSLPPEAADVWHLWQRIPPRQREFFREQMKSAAEAAERFPDLMAVLNQQAAQAATEARLARQRQKKSGT